MGVAAVLHGRSGAVRAGIDPLLRGAGTAVLPPVGYLFVAATTAGLARLEQRMALQHSLGVPVERADVPKGSAATIWSAGVACRQDGVADPAGVTRELLRRAGALGGRCSRGRRSWSRLRCARDLLRPALCRARAGAAGAHALPPTVRDPAARPDGVPADGDRGGDRLPVPPQRAAPAGGDAGPRSTVGIRRERGREHPRRPARAARVGVSGRRGGRGSTARGRVSTT
jgi:hypothetical protein